MKTTGATKRKKQKISTRNRLIRVAQDEFARKGLMATTTLDIAREAEVSHGTVFAHFPARDDLIVSVIEEFGEQVIRRIYALTEQEMTVRDILAAHLNILQEYEPFYARLVMEAPVLPTEARITLIAIQSAVSFHLYAAARREMKAGTLRSMPMHLLFNTWIGLVHHYLNNRDLFAPGESVIARRGQELLDHYMSLLALPKGE